MDKINNYVDSQLSSIFKENCIVLRPKEVLRKIIDDRLSEIELRDSKVKKKKKVD
jgi:hypothetical protein